jgi:hypothetical protein
LTYAAASEVAHDPAPQLKMEVGDWQICEDMQGEYYVHIPTGQTYDEPPPELVQLRQATQWQHAVQYTAAPAAYAAPVTYAAAPQIAYHAAPVTYAAPPMTFAAAPANDVPAPFATVDSMLQPQPEEQAPAPVVNSAPPPAAAPNSKKRSANKKGCC